MPRGQGKAAFGLSGDPSVLAHEAGHNLKLYHAPCPTSGKGAPSNTDPQWPYTNASIQEIGFDTYKGGPVNRTASDIMSYCSNQWISPYHWKKLFNELAPSSSSSAGVSNASTQTYAFVRGNVTDGGGAELDPLLVVEGNGTSPSLPEGGEYCLTFYGGGEEVLATHCFDLSFTNSESGEPTGQARFSYMLPYPEGAAGVSLSRGEQPLAEMNASPHAPEITLDSPGAGEEWGGRHSVSWTATDADGDDLSFALLYSHDGGENWIPMALSLTDTAAVVDMETLPGGEAARIRVLASDGFNTTHVDSPDLMVPQKAPEVLIGSPTEDGVFGPGEAVPLSGSAHDPEDGTISDVALSWWSDRDGLLGRGSMVIVPGLELSPGAHTITLRASDSQGAVGTTRVNIVVGYGLDLPLVMR